MKLSAEEKAARKAAFRAMNPAGKLEYIYTYYKWPILLGLIALLVLGSVAHRQLTKKEPAVYLALANVAVGEDLEAALTAGFLRDAGYDPARREVYLYKDLYLSDEADTLNHEYAYASRMKLMGAIQAWRLDAVIMNREAYDLLSQGGYLLDLAAPLSEPDPALLPLLTQNAVILSDNGIEYQLGEAETHEVVTEDVYNGVLLSALPRFRAAGFGEDVYFGVIANSPRTEAALQYLHYLTEETT